jgi:hypothetical protein
MEWVSWPSSFGERKAIEHVTARRATRSAEPPAPPARPPPTTCYAPLASLRDIRASIRARSTTCSHSTRSTNKPRAEPSMPTISAHGITARLPRGFEGRIFVRPPTVGMTYPVAQFATFPIPDDIGDFGSGAVTLMGPSDVFATLFEFGPESVGTALFSQQGLPTALSTTDFSPTVLRRGIPGQSGTQRFFTEAGRPFSLYAVLGSHALRQNLVPRVNGLLASLSLTASTSDAVATSVPRPLWN